MSDFFLRFFAVAINSVWFAFFSFSMLANSLAVTITPIVGQPNSTWFASEDVLYQLNNGSHQIVANLPLEETKALEVNAKESNFLVLSEKRILKLSLSGIYQWDKSLAELGLEEAQHLTLNPYDSSFWIVSGKRLIHFDFDGHQLSELKMPGNGRMMAIALDESLWILGGKQLWHYAPSGTLLSTHTLPSGIEGKVMHLAVDSLGNRLWIASKSQLARYELNNMAKPALIVILPAPIDELAIDPLTGMLWMAGETKLLAYSNNAISIINIELASLGLYKPEFIAFDPQKMNLWLGHKAGIAKIGLDGALLANIPLNTKVKVIGVPSFFVTPKLTLIQPSTLVPINNVKPTISLHLDAMCFGVPCGFAPTNYGNFQVTASLNGQQIGNLFSIDTTTGQASYTPSTALPEGRNIFTAQARDRFGHISNLIDTIFTIDAAMLKILDISPGDGSILSGSQVFVSGTFHGPSNTGITVNDVIASISGDKFYANVPLQIGSNTLRVRATTPDGLIANKTVSITTSKLSSFRVSPSFVEGVAPLKVVFSVDSANGKTVQYINADFDGNGTVDQSVTAPNLAMEFNYDGPGIYHAKFEIIDTQGQSDLVEVLVVVKDPAEMDKQFQSIWDGLNTALIARDKPKALSYLNQSARVKYEPVFSALLPNFPAIVASYSALQRVSITSDMGEYAVNRVIDGVDEVFFIYLLRDTDGVWRLDSM